MGGAAPYWLDWTFDTIGNRRTETSHTTTGDTTRTFTYPTTPAPRPHAVQSITVDTPTTDRVDTYTYDETGNTQSRTHGDATQTLGYDVEGRLTTVTEPDGDASGYLYDAEGNRLLKREPTGTTLYLPGTELRRDAATGEVTGTRYYTHNGTTVATRTPAGLTWTIPDHHGTVTTTVTADATTATKRYHDPYGNPRGPAPATWPTTRGYLNAPTDTTGYTHLGARDYDPTTGRFTTVDPILDTKNPQHLNAYTYSNNNPTTFTDPDGLCYVGDYENYCGGHEPPRGKPKEQKQQDQRNQELENGTGDPNNQPIIYGERLPTAEEMQKGVYFGAPIMMTPNETYKEAVLNWA